MIVSIVIPCHNQDYIVKSNIRFLQKQTKKPDHVIVIDDKSDIFSIKKESSVDVLHTTSDIVGRAAVRNLGIRHALDMGSDVIIFMDGDTVPAKLNYIENYLKEFKNGTNKVCYGTRFHATSIFNGALKSKHGYSYPADMLTASAQSMAEGKGPVYKDLRLVAKVPNWFNNLKQFDEKVDAIMTGWVSWSCNFAVGRRALEAVWEFSKKIYGRHFYFDDVMFKKWGHEDTAFGLDVLWAGAKMRICLDVPVKHLLHKRSDKPFANLNGTHIMLQRYRKLYKHALTELH